MELGVRVTSVVLKLLHWLLAPVFWLLHRGHGGVVPPLRDSLLMDSAVSLARKIRDGELTSLEVVSAYISRIKEVNPYINAVVEERFEDALDDARQVDSELEYLRRNGGVEGVETRQPFLGVPFTVKESCSLAGMSNAVGCLELRGRRAPEDGGATRLLRDAGALPLLVSNTPELCLGWETSNLLNGTTNNPYCLSRTPGGSSGGEAALIASGASVLGVASDIAGSIRVPAAFTGIFGHKPTPGIVSIDGHIPTLKDEKYPRYLTLGPLVRNAEDLEPTLRVMAGENAPMLRLDETVDLKKLKVYYMTEATSSSLHMSVDQSIKDAINNAVKYLRTECGATVCEDKFKGLEDSVEMSVSAFFAMEDIPNLLEDPIHSKNEKSLIAEFIKYLLGIGSRSLQGLGFALVTKTKVFIPQSRRAHYIAKADKLSEQMKIALGDNGVFLYPAFNGQAHYHNEVFLKASGVMYSMMFNIFGMPVTTVPLGIHRGLPVSVQVIAAPNQDRLCLAVARQLEIGFGGWRPPS